MKIGNLHFEDKAALAPMAGVADRAMREICREYGAAFTVTELISSKGVSMNDKKSFELLDISDKERPAGIQLFGNQPEIMAAAAEKAAAYRPEFIDINMGCPAPKVANNNGGSSLHKDPALAGEIVAAVIKAAGLPVSAKIRAGWDEDSINAVEMAKVCEQAGAAFITVHGRTRSQMYAPPVNLDVIKAVKQAVRIPVVGNGDIRSPKDAAHMLEYTGCDMVMVGRGVDGSPWVFQQINAYLNHQVLLPDPPVSQRMLVLLRQVKSMIRYKGEYRAMREARRCAAAYIKGQKGAARFRQRCGTLTTYQQLTELAFEVAGGTPSNE